MEVLECDEISSIVIESMTRSVHESQEKLISNEISSIEMSSVEDVQCGVRSWRAVEDVRGIRERLKGNVELLHEELRRFGEENARGKRTRAEGIVEELKGVKMKIEELKAKLKGSEELIDEKVKENSLLKKQLMELEKKEFLQEKDVACKHCAIW